MPRHSDVSNRVIAALRIGPATNRELSKLLTISVEQAHSACKRLVDVGKVHIVGTRKHGRFGNAMPLRPMNVYALVEKDKQ